MMWPAHTLDELGRCCGRKPIVHKRRHERVCPICERAYDLAISRQHTNRAWRAVPGGYEQQRPSFPLPQRHPALLAQGFGVSQ